MHLLIPILLAPLCAPLTPQATLAALPPAEVRTVTVAPDGSAVAAAASDRMIRLWDVPAGKERLAFKLAAPVSEIAFAPDGRRLATLAGGLELWDADHGKPLKALPDVSAFQLAFAPGGMLAVAGHRVGFREAATLKARPDVTEQAGWLNTCVAFSGDGALAVTGDIAGNIWVWDVATGTLRLRRKGHDNRVTGAGFIDDGRTVVSGGSDGRMKFWDLKTGREVGLIFPHGSSGLGRGIGALVCSRDGRTIVTGGADDGLVRLFEAATGQLRATLALPRTGALHAPADRAYQFYSLYGLAVPGTGVTSLSIALDGSTLAAGGKRNGGGVVAAWRLYAPTTPVTRTLRPTLWQDLAGDSVAAYQAILAVAAQPRAGVARLNQRLHPVKLNATVRKECDALIALLESDRFDVRDQANHKLEAMSPWVEPYLRESIATAKTLELKRRLQGLITKVGSSTLPLLRAVEVLEARLESRSAAAPARTRRGRAGGAHHARSPAGAPAAQAGLSRS